MHMTAHHGSHAWTDNISFQRSYFIYHDYWRLVLPTIGSALPPLRESCAPSTWKVFDLILKFCFSFCVGIFSVNEYEQWSSIRLHLCGRLGFVGVDIMYWRFIKDRKYTHHCFPLVLESFNGCFVNLRYYYRCVFRHEDDLYLDFKMFPD